MQLSIKKIIYPRIEFELNDFDSKDKNIELETNLSVGSDHVDSNTFCITINVSIISKDEIIKLNLLSKAFFSTDTDITSDFMKSDFLKINAPAIAFPYIRAFISNLTLNSGIDPIMLPSFNFVEIAKQQAEKIEIEKCPE
jgi:preprotein translocase subunit SecB